VPIDPEKGSAMLDLGEGAYFVTEGVYRVMSLRTEDGLIFADAPPSIGPRLLAAAEEVAPGAPITRLIYSHAHVDTSATPARSRRPSPRSRSSPTPRHWPSSAGPRTQPARCRR
jgi:hypothetical protein